ncbi:alpha/beta hydrolase [Glycomyces luteolus]|uniref:Alpha/beta hydrolase n=2 Tax=Glycomyces TaxID=58113 RepID=A0A9X3PCZ3_9ACTN|nr:MULTISPECIES: alpha/beta hydrolase [Glycomyces]MDA1362499.1 alpha/beta hydrolase [Glycomyces luteolus]MDN3239164.1 alpha/beta hydrolase [Glycomyces tritici]
MSKHAFHPDLRLPRFLPRSIPLGLARRLSGLVKPRPPRGGELVRIDADVSVRIFRPPNAVGAEPALLWIHAGGYVLGGATLSDDWCRQVTGRLGVIAAAVEYRLAPKYPFPTALEDCYAALQWLAAESDVDADRIAIGGESAGGGLAAALALLAKERGTIRPVLQVLSYPMLDDRTAQRTDIDPSSLRMWSQKNNRWAWNAYLGAHAATPPQLAAPARYGDLTGVAPAWMGVGTNDLFHDEDLAYAERSRQAGVPCELEVVPGAYHGFDLGERDAAVSVAYKESQMTALERALSTGRPDDKRRERIGRN